MSDESDETQVSIGAVSRATGIPPSTLRTWERRYGFPDPCRTEAGHRRYSSESIDRLQLVADALDRGCRPSDVVALPEEKLRDIVGEGASSGEESNGGEEPDWLETWLEAVRELDGSRLTALLRSDWNRMGGLSFLAERLRPFLVELGELWRAGEAGIVHEHFASEQLQDFLSSRWRPESERSSGPTVVCATTPKEDHVLGLHIAALLFAMAGWRIVFLGARTPTADIVEAVDIDQVEAVASSFSSAHGTQQVRDIVHSLRRALESDVWLVVGGAGTCGEEFDSEAGVLKFDDLESYYQWAVDVAAGDAKGDEEEK